MTGRLLHKTRYTQKRKANRPLDGWPYFVGSKCCGDCVIPDEDRAENSPGVLAEAGKS
jgi:hypothetical protein